MTHLIPMTSFGRKRAGILVCVCLVLLAGCHQPSRDHRPKITITEVPKADLGGPQKMGYLAGSVSDAEPGDHVVLYARSGVWWLQPFANNPLTTIQPDQVWKNSTHLGIEYAALLVEPGFHPALRLAALPAVGNGVLAVTSLKGEGSETIVPKVLHFSGYDWTVNTSDNDRGGVTNSYDPDNAWVDAKGYLHLRMMSRNGKLSCAEVSLERSLGYGLYRFVVQDSAHLDPSATVGLFTFDELSANENRTNELDIELSRWGNAASKNAQYVVQPFFVPENVSRFMAPAGELTHSFRWEPGKVTFQTTRGAALGTGQKLVSEKVFTSGVPVPASEKVHMDLYDFQHSKNPSRLPTEVVVEKFEYLP